MKVRSTLINAPVMMILLVSFLLAINACTNDEPNPLPTIMGFNPDSGAEGATILISGTHFSTALASNIVLFGTVQAVVAEATPTQLTVTVPAGATTGKVTVTVDGQTATSEMDFTVTTSTVVIGTMGGSLKGSDGVVSVVVPEGAVPANTTVSVVATTEVAPNGIGKIYTITPEGTTFDKPVILSFQYTDADAAKTPPALMAIGYRKADNTWVTMPTLAINETTKTITTQTSHFSQWTLLEVEEGITLKDDHIAYNDVAGSLFNLSWTYIDNGSFKLDTVLQIRSTAVDTFTVTLPYKARLYGYTPGDGYSSSTVSFSCTSKNAYYQYDKNKGDTDSNSVRLTEVKSDGYSVGTFSFPVVVSYYDAATALQMTAFETLEGSYRLKTPK